MHIYLHSILKLRHLWSTESMIKHSTCDFWNRWSAANQNDSRSKNCKAKRKSREILNSICPLCAQWSCRFISKNVYKSLFCWLLYSGMVTQAALSLTNKITVSYFLNLKKKEKEIGISR